MSRITISPSLTTGRSAIVDAQDPDLGEVDDRRREEAADLAGVGDREGPAAEVLRRRLARAASVSRCDLARAMSRILLRSAFCDDRHDEPGLRGHGDADVEVACGSTTRPPSRRRGVQRREALERGDAALIDEGQEGELDARRLGGRLEPAAQGLTSAVTSHSSTKVKCAAVLLAARICSAMLAQAAQRDALASSATAGGATAADAGAAVARRHGRGGRAPRVRPARRRRRRRGARRRCRPRDAAVGAGRRATAEVDPELAREPARGGRGEGFALFSAAPRPRPAGAPLPFARARDARGPASAGQARRGWRRPRRGGTRGAPAPTSPARRGGAVRSRRRGGCAGPPAPRPRGGRSAGRPPPPPPPSTKSTDPPGRSRRRRRGSSAMGPAAGTVISTVALSVITSTIGWSSHDGRRA